VFQKLIYKKIINLKMIKIRKFRQYVAEKFVDTTGTVDKSVLDYWNGLYDKWTKGTLTAQEKSDYEKASAAKIYYIYEDKNSDVYKKLMEWEKKASEEADMRDIRSFEDDLLNKSKERTGFKSPVKQYEKTNTVGAFAPYQPTKTTKTAGGHKPTTEALHAFLDTIQVPWEAVCSDLGIKLEKLPNKESWRKALSNWFTNLGDDITDRLERFNDWLFPEKTEVEMYRDLWKDRDIKSTRK
jgi:arsenate reductase-like glutaredoxin family protein